MASFKDFQIFLFAIFNEKKFGFLFGKHSMDLFCSLENGLFVKCWEIKLRSSVRKGERLPERARMGIQVGRERERERESDEER